MHHAHRNHETAAAAAWLGRQYLSDPEVRSDFDNLMRAPDCRSLAFAMQKIVAGGAMTELTAEHKGLVDFEDVARGLIATRLRYARPTMTVQGIIPLATAGTG